ncbi:MAG: ester cyclase [Chloroflexi bacterium]|nr:ester cyclase [Chloroflexota bacterium]
MSTEQNKEIVRRYRNAHNSNQLNQLDDIMAPNLISHNLIPGLPQGRETGKQVHQMALASFPDSQTRTEEIIAEGDKVVERWTVSGTHSGAPFMGRIPPSGKSFTVSGVSIYRIADGKIVEHWGEFDTMNILQQLGAVPGM